MANAQRKDDLDISDAPESTTRGEILKRVTDFSIRADDKLAVNHSIMSFDPNNPSRMYVARAKLRDLMARKADTAPASKLHGKLDEQIEATKQEIETYGKSGSEHVKAARSYSGFCDRFRVFDKLHERELIPDPITPAAKPSKERIAAASAEDVPLAKAYEKLENIFVPIDTAFARGDSFVDSEAKLFNPSVETFLSRKGGQMTWPHRVTTSKDYELLGLPNGGPALCWLFPDQVKARLRAKIEAAYKANGTAGMSRDEITAAKRTINKKRLALHREIVSHILGFERDGIEVLYPPELSIFAVFQMRAEGVSALRGKDTNHDEAW
jgi:hypothetical protein